MSRTLRGRWARSAAVLAVTALVAACGDDGGAAPESTDAAEVPAEAAPGVLELVDPVTDNYKACFNADPAVRELRTWLTLTAVEVDGVRYAAPADGIVAAEGGLALAGDGGEATLRAPAADGAATVALRAQGGRFGPLVTVADPQALVTSPVEVELVLVVDGAEVATATVEYRHDPELAAGTEAGELEHNGPGGRWAVAGGSTQLNWEAEGTGPAC